MQKQLELHQHSPTGAKKIFNSTKLTLSAQSELPPLSTLTFFLGYFWSLPWCVWSKIQC